MQKRHRIFIAINLPSDVKKVLSGYEKKWSRSQNDRGSSIESGPDLPVKWTSAENLHITLVFLGDLTDIELGEVCVTVKEITKNHNSLNVHLYKVDYGPDDKAPTDGANFAEAKLRLASRPRFIWAGGEKSKELSLLKKDLQEALLKKVSFMPELRTFSPHITLARINTFSWRQIEPEERPDVNENIDLTFTVESIEIMESELKRGGPQYTVIESHLLR